MEKSTKVKFTKWLKAEHKVDVHQERKNYDDRLLALMVENTTLKEQNVSLQEKMKIANKKEKDLLVTYKHDTEEKDKIQLNLEKKIKTLKPLEKELTESRSTVTQLGKKLRESSRSFKLTVEELKQRNKETVLRLKEVTVEKDKYKKEKELSEITIKSLTEKADKNIAMKQNYEKEIKRLESSVTENKLKAIDIGKLMAVQKEAMEKEEIENNNARVKSQEMINELEQKIGKMKIEIDNLRSKDLNSTVAKLISRNSDLITVIRNKNREITAQSKHINNLLQDTNKLQSKAGLLEVTLRMAKEEIKEKENNENIYEENKEVMEKNYKELQTKYIKINEKFNFETARFKARNTEVQRLQETVGRHTHKSLLLQQDLQACANVFSHPKLFAVQFKKLLEKYINTEELSEFISIEKQFEHKLKNIRDMVEKTVQHHNCERQQLRRDIDYISHSYYTNAQLVTMNKTIQENMSLMQKNEDLKKEIVERDKLLQKSMKPAHLKLLSWWQKKVPKNSQKTRAPLQVPQDSPVQGTTPPKLPAKHKLLPSTSQHEDDPDANPRKDEDFELKYHITAPPPSIASDVLSSSQSWDFSDDELQGDEDSELEYNTEQCLPLPTSDDSLPREDLTLYFSEEKADHGCGLPRIDI